MTVQFDTSAIIETLAHGDPDLAKRIMDAVKKEFIDGKAAPHADDPQAKPVQGDGIDTPKGADDEEPQGYAEYIDSQITEADADTGQNADGGGGGGEKKPELAGSPVSCFWQLVEKKVTATAKGIPKSARPKPREIEVTLYEMQDWQERGHSGGGAFLEKFYGGDERDLLFDHAAADWYKWNGIIWQKAKKDDITQLFNVLQEIVDFYLSSMKAARKKVFETMVTQSGDRKAIDKSISKFEEFKKSAGSSGFVNGACRFAAAGDNSFGDTGENWDQKPQYLLPCLNGILDLRKGKLRAGRRADRLLLQILVEYEPDARCPRWEKFILEIMNGNEEHAAFIQRLFGYCILRNPKEQKFVICWGGGANGKSVLFEVVNTILGKLCIKLPAEFFLNSKTQGNGRGPDEQTLTLRGAAIGYAAETAEGRSFNVSKVKELCGNDTLTARPCYGKPIEFTPFCQLFLLTNERPHAPADSYSFWRRVVLIPFLVTFCDNPDPALGQKQKDENLQEYLLNNEREGILRWMVEGAQAYQEQGLNIPEEFIEATREYQEGEDYIRRFLEDVCEDTAGTITRTAEMYATFKAWMQNNGFKKVISDQDFAKRMEKAGYLRIRRNDTRYWEGVKIVNAPGFDLSSFYTRPSRED